MLTQHSDRVYIRTVIPNSMCWAMMLKTLDEDSGSSSHQREKHSVKSLKLGEQAVSGEDATWTNRVGNSRPFVSGPLDGELKRGVEMRPTFTGWIYGCHTDDLFGE